MPASADLNDHYQQLWQAASEQQQSLELESTYRPTFFLEHREQATMHA
jgi:hypothetical protein